MAFEFTSDDELRRYLKHLGCTLEVSLRELPKNTVCVLYRSNYGECVFAEQRAVGQLDADHLALMLRDMRRSLADAARAVVVGRAGGERA